MRGNIIEELYYGNIDPQDRGYSPKSPVKKASDSLNDLEEKLTEQLAGENKALLNEQFVNDCDAAVAILWTRFGTPTDEYGSGTEEEVEIMLSSGKQVFMYFSDKPLSPSQMNEESYKKVQAFREKYKDRGIYFTY